MKIKTTLLSMTMLLLCLFTASCSPAGMLASAKAELGLFRAEFAEILEFFDKSAHASKEPSVPAEAALTDEKSAPILESLAHTEMIDSPYYSGRRVLYDAGTSDKEENIPADLSAYRSVSHFTDRTVQSVSELLKSRGITAEVELVRNTAPAGEVFALRYAGYSVNSTYYINPSVTVTLYVSDKKEALTESVQRQNLVYLTFDDGPTESDTVRLLDTLDTYGVKAAFFVMGTEMEKYPASAKAIADRGHALGCHTVTHNYASIYRSAETLTDEITWWEKIAADAGIGLKSKLFRFPGGSVGTYLTGGKSEVMTKSIEEMGYTVFDWNVVTNDSLLYMAPKGENTYDYIRENFISTFELCLRENEKKDNAPIIILMHETVRETVDLMPWMIEYLTDRGFAFGDLADFGQSWTFADR